MDSKVEQPSALGYRHLQAFLMFTMISCAYTMRVCLSVAIVAMTDPSVNSNVETYDWDDQSTILSSFFWGYTITQVGAGILIRTTGTRWLLFCTMFASSLASVLIPFIAGAGSWVVMICRIVQGLAQGAFFPSCHTILSKWVPPQERSRLGTLAYSGNSFGTIIAMPVTGWIANSRVGWPYAFYFFGALGFAWCIAWIIFGSESPAEHRKITPNERLYIETSIGSNPDAHIPLSSLPWKSFLTSLPVWSIFLIQLVHNWGFMTLLTEIPSYLSGIHKFNISQNGLLSACPYLAMWVMSFFFGAMTDFLINKGYVSTGNGRKLATSISQLGPAVALFLLGAFGDNGSGIAMALLIIGVALNGAHLSGFLVNLIDLSPKYAGVLMGFCNGISQLTSIVGPLIVQVIVTDSSNSSQWALVFYIAGVIYIVGNTWYIVFASGERQPWDDSSNEQTKQKKKNNSQSDALTEVNS